MHLWTISYALEQALAELVTTWRNNILSYSAKLFPRWNAPYQAHALSIQAIEEIVGSSYMHLNIQVLEAFFFSLPFFFFTFFFEGEIGERLFQRRKQKTDELQKKERKTSR